MLCFVVLVDSFVAIRRLIDDGSDEVSALLFVELLTEIVESPPS